MKDVPKNGWKKATKGAVENQDLWQALLELVEKNKVTFYRVKGHVNLNSQVTDFDELYEKFLEWNGADFSYEDFMYVTEKNNQADALANKGIDSLR